jgi:hypothetical protein
VGLKKKTKILRVDPIRRTIAAMTVLIGKDAIPVLKKLCRVARVGWHEIMEIEGTKLTVAGGLDQGEDSPAWRVQGCEANAGIGILFGQAGGGMTDCPVTREWLDSRIIWLDGEDLTERNTRADDAIALMAEDLRDVMRSAMPTPSGAMWLALDKSAHFQALINLGLTAEEFQGQRLTALGVVVHDKLTESTDA